MDTERTIHLPRTIEVGDHRVTQITLREPTIGDVMQAQKNSDQTAAAIQLIALSAGLPSAVVQKFPISVFKEASSFIEGFISGGPETGET